MARYLEVREIGTDEVVRRLDVTGKTRRHREAVEAGLERRIDLEKFYVADVEESPNAD